MKLYRGMGMYPDETCFDPTRPSWLPYYVDTFGEEKCKLNEVLWGNKTGNTVPASQPGADPQTVDNTALACVAQGGEWDPSTNLCTVSPLGQFGQFLPWIVGGLVALTLLPAMWGRR